MTYEWKDISVATIRNWTRIWTNNFSHKLKSRANKRLSEKNIIPEEYIKYTSIIEMAYWYYNLWFTIQEIIFSLILNITKNVSNTFLEWELKKWNISNKKIINELVEMTIDGSGDILWWIYQSLLTEWEKNKKWSYYTPDYIAQEQINNFFKEWNIFLDPCCWTGQYLLNIPTKYPKNIWGTDSDELAVKIARINLMVKYPDTHFEPNIFHLDSLTNSPILKEWFFDVIATNPPWWAKLDTQYFWYSITSWESFSYFLEKWLKLLKKWWILSYILPESILNVKTHKDIRKEILKYDILSIHELWRIFTWVFTPAIRIDIKKQNKNWNINIYANNKNHITEKKIFKENSNLEFSIHINEENNKLLQKIYSRKNLFLSNENADWALWIVTWNNKEFISDIMKDWYIPIYTWKEVFEYKLWKNKKYLLYNPEKYQQIAPLDRYQATPKLIYKFISKRLVFSLDTEWVFTLNSANIIVPKLNYPIKVITALFNSELYQQIFQKKFNSIKILKSHIQELPLPILDNDTYIFIEKLFDKVIEWKAKKQELDEYIFNLLTK